MDKILTFLETKSKNKYRSDEIGILYGALAIAQGKYKKLVPNEESASGKYANLEAILRAVTPSLSEQKLTFYHYIELLDEGSGAALLITVLGHESGQYISSSARVMTGKTDRATGNTYEIHKRLHALMILGIAPSSNDPVAFDDDGGEQQEEQMIERIKNPKLGKVIDPNKVISKDLYTNLMIELDGYEEIVQDIMNIYKIDTLADMPQEVYQDALAKIRRIRKANEDYEKRKK